MPKHKNKACEDHNQAANNSTEEQVADQQTNAEEVAAQTPEAGIAQLQEQLAQQKAQAEEYLAGMQRLQADFENFRRRTKLEKEHLLKYGAEGLICELLPILDNLERAQTATGDETSLQKGVDMVCKQLQELLAGQGLQVICAVGQSFDPNQHQAVMKVPSTEYPDNQVVEEFQKGYQLKEKVIRPAMVKVAVTE